ncbi:YfjI family protein [Paracoccus marcusii]|uniref:YfjI family protein n=1 Tax=Paracoccus marcusii TaxID=59779 RepID=UPI003263F7E2
MNGLPNPNQCKAEGPQPLLREIALGRPYPVHALGPLKAVVEAVQGMTLAPIAIPAASALAVASLAVQGFCDVETLGGTRPLSLYVLTVATSGERKSSCDAPLMAALRAFEKDEAKAQRDNTAAWRNAHALWTGERDLILSKARAGKGEKSVSALADLESLGKEPAAPPSAERTVTEPTYEGLTRKYAEGMPALGIFSDEGGQFLGGVAMSRDNRQKTLAALNDLWQGNPIRRTRQGDGSLTLYGRRLAVHLMVQPGVARAFMADPMAADTGFLPRFLICEPPSTIGTRLQAHVKHDGCALLNYETRLREILDVPLPMDPDTRELQPRLLHLSSDARKIVAQFADAVETAQAKGGEYAHITGYASKAAEQAARIAGVMTVWKDLNALEVTGETMADALKLADFYLSEAARLADAATVTAAIERAEALIRWLLDTWQDPVIVPSDVVQRAPIRALRESPAAHAAIALLEQHGWLEKLPEDTVVRGVRRKVAYRIVRTSHDI